MSGSGLSFQTTLSTFVKHALKKTNKKKNRSRLTPASSAYAEAEEEECGWERRRSTAMAVVAAPHSPTISKQSSSMSSPFSTSPFLSFSLSLFLFLFHQPSLWLHHCAFLYLTRAHLLCLFQSHLLFHRVPLQLFPSLIYLKLKAIP